ncbi:hypothetical protein AAT19DRAFT_15128 [Rhodotorula toruloides]|uniref:Uncharacterized protein n=1 Tax=Rhodotorula toruloides TaxID=5286 RepID=A0A2T0A6B3_RHOTO|nr:hypothetical protein AAT19DRAFT_15128 [Rhodotorula toruloides]
MRSVYMTGRSSGEVAKSRRSMLASWSSTTSTSPEPLEPELVAVRSGEGRGMTCAGLRAVDRGGGWTAGCCDEVDGSAVADELLDPFSSSSIWLRRSSMYAIVPCEVEGQAEKPGQLTCETLTSSISSLCNPPRSPASSPRPLFRPRSLARAILRSPSSLRLGTVSLSTCRHWLIFSRLLRSISECETLRFEDPATPAARDDEAVGGGEVEGLGSLTLGSSSSRSKGEGWRGRLRAAAIAAERRGRLAVDDSGSQSSSSMIWRNAEASFEAGGGESKDARREGSVGRGRLAVVPVDVVVTSLCGMRGGGSSTRWSTGSVVAGRGTKVERGVGGSHACSCCSCLFA